MSGMMIPSNARSTIRLSWSIIFSTKRLSLGQNAEELPQGGHIACFAYVGEEIVGCGGICLYHEMPSPDNLNGKCAYLMNIYTRPQFRGHGIGNRIVRWLVEQARQRHISKIYLETSDKGRPLYQTIGFADMKDMMKLSREK